MYDEEDDGQHASQRWTIRLSIDDFERLNLPPYQWTWLQLPGREPESVFFRGQTAPAQMRNTGGIHFSDDLYVLAGLVDNSGYSTGIREKYQAYLITEVTLQFGAQTLKPGAYGVGFIEGGKFVVLDLAANDIFRVPSQKDTEIKRPVPLQVTAAESGKYRLYAGREFVEFSRARR